MNTINTYHQYNKSSSYLREAIFAEYEGKCFYCAHLIEYRNMHIDHILPTNRPDLTDDDGKEYIKELQSKGFIQDSIENYVPTCPSCNMKKGNMVYTSANLRYFHEQAKNHSKGILKKINIYKQNKNEVFYEPVNALVWEEIDFSYQRGINYALMGYRLGEQDVEVCPELPQVEKIEKQLSLVDYILIQGEPGCGKSISLFQLAYRFYKKGWRVYAYRGEETRVVIPENTEDSLYLFDDAQTYSDLFLIEVQRQARPNRKIVFAKTKGKEINSDTVVLTNSEGVKLLKKYCLEHKKELLPIVQRIDNSVGVNIMQMSMERRVELASKAITPWQFTFILRGGWKTIKENYKAVSAHNNNDLLIAAIAMFQILGLDKSIDYYVLIQSLHNIDSRYNWDTNDLNNLIKGHIVLSEDDVRIVHIESAYCIVALFFDSDNEEKKRNLLTLYEEAYSNKKFSPLGISWLFYGIWGYSKNFHNMENIVITSNIKSETIGRIKPDLKGEEARDIIAVLNILIQSDINNRLKLLVEYMDDLIEVFNNVDHTSAYAMSEFFNNLINNDKKIYKSFLQRINWHTIFESIDYEARWSLYSWGCFINRGMGFVSKKFRDGYIDDYDKLVEKVSLNANDRNIVDISKFFCDTYFMHSSKVFETITKLNPIYKNFFRLNMKNAGEIIDYEFAGYFCGIYMIEGKVSNEQKEIGKMIVGNIPITETARALSESNVSEWNYLEFVLIMIRVYDAKKYCEILQLIDLNVLSESISMSWNQIREISMICEELAFAGKKRAQEFIEMNIEHIQKFYSVLVMINPKQAIECYLNDNIPIDLFTEHWWEYSIKAIKALNKEDEEFTIKYLKNNVHEIAQKYSEVTALDFVDNYSLELLKVIKKIDENSYRIILDNIDKDLVKNRWDKCGGISPHKRKWVNKRKNIFFELIGAE